MLNIDLKRQGWDLVVPAWTQANIVAPATEPLGCTTVDGPGGEVWINPQLHHRRKILEKNAFFKNYQQEVITMQISKCAAYLRSVDSETDKANRAKLKNFAEANCCETKWYNETATMGNLDPADRPVLAKAMNYCTAHNASLIVANVRQMGKTKLEGLTFFAANDVDFNIIKSPTVNKNNVEMACAFARDDVQSVSLSVKKSLAEIKDRLANGTAHISKKGNMISTLGSPDPSIANKAKSKKALDNTMQIWPYLRELRERGLSFGKMADELNAKGMFTPTSSMTSKKSWHASTVRILFLRGEEQNAKSD